MAVLLLNEQKFNTLQIMQENSDLVSEKKVVVRKQK
jgi:hypothetical protein